MVDQQRALNEAQILDSTGARKRNDGAKDPIYEVQLEGEWIEVNAESYERVRQIQDSCA